MGIKLRMVTLGLALSLGAPVFGAALELSGTPVKKISGSGLDVPIYPTAKVTLNGPDKTTPTLPTLTLTGAGLREKRVALFKVNVYVAASYADNAKAVIAAGNALDALKSSKVKALQLTFLRDIKAEQMRDAFRDSLKENNTDAKTAPYAGLLEKLTEELPKGSKLTIIGVTLPGDNERVIFEMPSGTQVSGEGKNLADEFWKIWFGNPADSGLGDLKPLLSSKEK